MIDIAREEIFSLGEAARRLPRRSDGKAIHVNTLFRWSTEGLRGIVLETIRVGGQRCTTAQALQRFCEALSMRQMQQSVSPSRKQAIDAAAARLRRRGFKDGGNKKASA